MPMRVLMISKACVVGAYQTKLERLARAGDIELLVVVPPAWREGQRTLALERAYTTGYRLEVEPIVFNGSFHFHFYPRLGRRMREFAPDIVHIDEEPYNWATAHALLLAKRYGAHALWFSWQNLYRRYPPPFWLIERYTLTHADYALVGSEGAAAVWRRIEAGEVDIPAGPWWLMRLADWLAQPRRALAVLAVLMLLGAGTGLVQGWMRSHEVARARYLAAVSPQEPGP